MIKGTFPSISVAMVTSPLGLVLKQRRLDTVQNALWSPHLFIAHFRRTKHMQEINSLFVFISRCAYFCRNKKVEIKGKFL